MSQARVCAAPRRRMVLWALGALLALAAAPLVAAPEPTCSLPLKGLTVCQGAYALCDKSTCKAGPNGQSVECTCPVLHGLSIGNPEQLGGSCTAPKGMVYSFFSFQGFQPKKQLSCPQGTQFAQCWNATCKLLPGGKKATCLCPLCPGPFVTPGGSCNPANCKSEILVGAAFPVQGSGCPGQ